MVLSLPFNLPFVHLSSVGNALIEGLAADLHMSTFYPTAGLHIPYCRSKKAGSQLVTALSINFVTYVLFEIPSNIILKLTTPRFWLPTLTFFWGIICVLTGITQNFAGFLLARFFIGVVDSGFIPGCVFYMSMWYKRDEQIYRTSLLLSAAGLAGGFGGVLVSNIYAFRFLARYSYDYRLMPLQK